MRETDNKTRIIEKKEAEAQKKFDDFLSRNSNFLSEDDHELLRKAFSLAHETHNHVVRSKNEPYIFHPIEVARIVAEDMGLGITSVISALLHEVPTQSDVSMIEIEKQNGKSVATIVEGLTKISGLDTRTKSVQAENFRKLLLTMAKDVRVILVKLADRLHNMRSLTNLESNRQLKMAMETSYLYAPLAHRLGLYNLKSELEDLSMRFIEPEMYTFIDQKLKETKVERERYIKEFLKPLKNKLDDEGFDYQIKSRTKSISSIWNKIKTKKVDFEDIYDIFALRIILNSSPEKEKEYCWRVYSIVTDIYQPNPSRLRDWISVPKSNGYESLHTTVVGPSGKWVEVQIRTSQMDEVAEQGFAAHWRYKGVKSHSDDQLENWLNRIRETIETSNSDATDFLDDVKLNLYSEEVFVFTPNGDLKKFPQGATVLDFAYDIHTDLGDKCVGARMNNKNVTIREKLRNGDQIEIISSKNQKPKTEWLNDVVTSKARTKIKTALRDERLKEAEYGKELLKRRTKNWKLNFNDEIRGKLLKYFKCKTVTDFYHDIANGKIDLAEIKDLLSEPSRLNTVEPSAQEDHKPGENEQSDLFDFLSDDFLVIADRIQNVDYKLAKCCNPVFGDHVFGFVTINEGIKIHRYSCPNAQELLSKYPYRVVRARWTKHSENTAFQTHLKVVGIPVPGLLGKLSEVISGDKKVTIRSISVESNEGLFEGTIKILIKDKEHLDGLISRLSKIKGVSKVTRQSAG